MTNKTAKPLFITMDDRDNVAIVVNDGGLPAGTVFSSGLTLVEKIPQAHKVTLQRHHWYRAKRYSRWKLGARTPSRDARCARA
jgi:hypothetical protein